MSTPMPGAGSPLEDANTAGSLLLPGSDVTTPDAAVPVGGAGPAGSPTSRDATGATASPWSAW